MNKNNTYLSLGVAAALAIAAAAPAHAMQAVKIGAFNAATDIRFLPSQANNLYVVEQPGRIMLMHNEVKRAKPFLDMQSIVQYNGERGLLSLAFAPDYTTTFKFYVLFVNLAGNVEVNEFRASAATPTVADFGTRRVLLEIPHPGAANHNGGQLRFGPDGYLYISVGDGGSTSNPGDPARKISSLLGKILRIDPHATATKPYRIPPDNPYVGKTGRDEIFAYGLRNPWRFSFAGNVMAIADVGQSRLEEVDMLPLGKVRGTNFGWPQYEAQLVYDPSKPGPDRAVFPMFAYAHTGDYCAIMGGFIAGDPQLPTLKGRYLYGDLCTGDIRSFKPDVANQKAIGDAATGVLLPGVTTFGVGRQGQIYVADGSAVYRLEP